MPPKKGADEGKDRNPPATLKPDTGTR
jgi:hypothetical protein